MKAGEEVLLSEVAAGRDEAEFPDADTFVIDRNPNRHVSFGVGIHRCPGSHLARITFSEMISAVLERMPDYHIDPDAVVDYPDWAMVGGWQRMPATFTPTAPLRSLTRVVDLSLSDEQEQLVEAFRVFFTKECPPTVVRDAEEAGGFDAALWRAVSALGGPTMGVAEELGGGGAGLLDLELVAERFGAALAPVPLVDGWVTARLLAASGEAGRARARPARRRRAAGGGRSRCIPRATAWRVSCPLARWRPSWSGSTTTSSWWWKASPTRRRGRTTSGARRSPTARCGRARARCWRTVPTRVALHERARRRVARAHRGRAGGPGRRRARARRRVRQATPAVRRADRLVPGARPPAGRCRHRGRGGAAARARGGVGGRRGRGRRGGAGADGVPVRGARPRRTPVRPRCTCTAATASRSSTTSSSTSGGPRRGRSRSATRDAARCTSPTRCSARSAGRGDGLMDFRLGEQQRRVPRRGACVPARALAAPTWSSAPTTPAPSHNWEFHRALGAQGWIAASWPEEYGGQGRDPFEMTAMRDELRLAGRPDRRARADDHRRPHHPRRRLRGAEAAVPPARAGRRDHLRPRVHRARLRLRRRRGEDPRRARRRRVGHRRPEDVHDAGPRGHVRASCSTRTNPDVPKHRGLTMFLVPLDAPGVEIHPVHTMGGERTNATFYSDVRVPDSLRVGEVDGGWDVMTVALTFERGGFALSEADRVWQQTVDWATATRRPDGTRVIDDPLVRERLADHAHPQRGGAPARAALLVRRRDRRRCRASRGRCTSCSTPRR